MVELSVRALPVWHAVTGQYETTLGRRKRRPLPMHARLSARQAVEPTGSAVVVGTQERGLPADMAHDRGEDRKEHARATLVRLDG